jgi:hypothetical protein
MGGDTSMSVDTKMPADTKMTGPATTSAPTTQFRATLPGGDAAAPAVSPATVPMDFGSLDFDLSPTKMNLEPPTKMPVLDTVGPATKIETEVFAATTPQRVERPAVADFAAALASDKSVMAPTATGVGMIPDLDLNIPSTRMPVAPAPVLEEALSRPTVVGAMKAATATTTVGGLPDEQAARLTANTDQATVPLIDFDLSAVSLDAATKRGETEPGSAPAIVAPSLSSVSSIARNPYRSIVPMRRIFFCSSSTP